MHIFSQLNSCLLLYLFFCTHLFKQRKSSSDKPAPLCQLLVHCLEYIYNHPPHIYTSLNSTTGEVLVEVRLNEGCFDWFWNVDIEYIYCEYKYRAKIESKCVPSQYSILVLLFHSLFFTTCVPCLPPNNKKNVVYYYYWYLWHVNFQPFENRKS